MTVSAAARKSVADLTRRRGRAFFAVTALALAVASLGLFALPALMNRAMAGEIAANKLADVTITVKPLALTAAQVRALSRLPNVVAFDPGARSRRASTSVRAGRRRSLLARSRSRTRPSTRSPSPPPRRRDAARS